MSKCNFQDTKKNDLDYCDISNISCDIYKFPELNPNMSNDGNILPLSTNKI